MLDVSGLLVKPGHLGKGNISSVVTGSMCEAEYIAASEAARQGVWMKEFITDLGVIPNASGLMTLFCDNTGAIAIAKEPRFHKKTRHIKRHFNSIRENVQDGDIDILQSTYGSECRRTVD